VEKQPSSPKAAGSLIVQAVDRLAAKIDPTTGKPLGRERAAARLLPHMKPLSAARYIRKLRSGERSGQQLVQRPSIARRVAIFKPTYRASALLLGATTGGVLVYHTHTFVLPTRIQTADQLKHSDRWPTVKAAAERAIRNIFKYPFEIIDVIDLRPTSSRRSIGIDLTSTLVGAA
jgi:hypothetical protein